MYLYTCNVVSKQPTHNYLLLVCTRDITIQSLRTGVKQVKDTDHSLENFLVKNNSPKCYIFTGYMYVPSAHFLMGWTSFKIALCFWLRLHHLVYVFVFFLLLLAGCTTVVVSTGNWSLIKNLAW